MITNKLKTASLKLTFQREKILEYIISQKEHPTAEMIYAHIVKVIPHISKTTVYNTLKLFEEKNIVQSLKIDDDKLRFEISSNSCSHGFLNYINSIR